MPSANSPTTGKRRRPSNQDVPPDPTENHDSSSSDDEVGPALPASAPPKKKRRVLQHESLYIAALPRGTRYSRSLMHTNQLAFVTFTPHTDFLITASINGVVAFWKKASGGEHVEFVKNFGAHLADTTGAACSWDGKSYASCSKDKTIKVWDVATFDMVGAITVTKTPSCICFVNGRGGSGVPLVAVGNEVDGAIEVFDGTGSGNQPLYTLKGVHKKPLSCLAYNISFDCVVSADENGMVEYWQPGPNAEKPPEVFDMKSKTDLFDFRKAKSSPASISISPTGKQFATFSFPDRKVRVFDFASGKLYRTYDESLTTINEMQQAGTALTTLEDVEFGKRLTVERELENPIVRKRMNVIFDETGNFILYGSLYGTKVINTLTNRVVKVYGQDEKLRPLNLALYQGQPEQKGVVTVQMAASENPLLREAEARDSMLVSTAQGKVRFYMFTNEEEISKPTRDIRNEKLEQSHDTNQTAKTPRTALLASAAVMHTTFGDIHLRLFPDAAPKSVENFITHSRNGYYNNVIFHRVIKKFMIQTGDPMGDGTGGESIWGGNFDDEFTSLKHDKPYTLSMANAGPNTNGSQFFITTVKTSWLDNKHTVFGRAVQGLDVVHKIENTKTLKHEKPEQDIKIVNIDVT